MASFHRAHSASINVQNSKLQNSSRYSSFNKPKNDRYQTYNEKLFQTTHSISQNIDGNLKQSENIYDLTKKNYRIP